MTARTPRGCVLRALTLYGAFLLCTLLLWLMGGHIAGWWMLRKEHRRWAATGTSMDALVARWPKQPDNAGAYELDRLTRPLGLHVVRDPARATQVDDRPLYDAMSKSYGLLSKTGDDSYDPPPPEVRAFLESHRTDLAAVAAHLGSGADITWETDLEQGPEAPIPNLYAHRCLNTALLTEALERHRRGDNAGAEQMLDAAWRQGETLAVRPELLSQLIAVALAGQHAQTLRRLSAPSAAWGDRLRKRRFLPAIIDSFQSEAYSMLTLTRAYRGVADIDAHTLPPRGPLGWAFRITTVPWVQMSLAGTSYHYRRGQKIARATDLCRVTAEDFANTVTREIADWDSVARLAVPSAMRAVQSGVSADVDSELTRLVVQARQGSAAATPDIHSTVCPGVTWRQVRGSDGRLTIRADPAPGIDPSSGRWSFTLAGARRR